MRRLYIVNQIVNQKENQGADSTWAPFEETNNGPSSVGFVNKSADHPHVGR